MSLKQLDTKQVRNQNVFFEVNGKFWRIGNKLYDFTPFLDDHPGGRQILELQRDYYEDATFAFEAFHPDQDFVRKQLYQYEVKGYALPISNNPSKIFPDLSDENSFYYDLRKRVSAYLRANGGKGPTWQCKVYFWCIVLAYLFLFFQVYLKGSFFYAFWTGIFSSLMGGFGHNWVHQKKYRSWAFGLDLVGLNSENWLKEHNLQHHMYTNTPLDNHFKGVEPFLVVDPTRKRNFWQGKVMPLLNPLVLSFGVLGNYIICTVFLFFGNDKFTWLKLVYPTHFCALCYRFGFAQGSALFFLISAVGSVYYFTIALMNHNTSETWNLEKIKQAQDWGTAQLKTSCDILPFLGFYKSIVFLWLNYHTVHHLFPTVDISKQPAIQKILIETAQIHNIQYKLITFKDCYLQMIRCFQEPIQLNQEVFLYYNLKKDTNK